MSLGLSGAPGDRSPSHLAAELPGKGSASTLLLLLQGPGNSVLLCSGPGSRAVLAPSCPGRAGVALGSG